MPQIYIPLSSRNPRDLVLLELQGTLEGSSDDCSDTSFAGEALGTIRFADTPTDSTPELIIGHHRLHGKLVPCAKPFAVLQKSSTTDASLSTEWHVLGIVRHRYLFKSRPHNVV
ncbi:hypothetical protein AMAG_02608 [Allomyces macrogynus ATCC 38327]|uniref:Chromosome transmission fidelity protein 8 n=1 Tax=Allomyces macrogynus (strain ATCC 38327) TaxID=578462 RepID=A0A0L0S343_ALLM3|nr:hypothetical protein AMAG_02608 [Allomyces macrogynus ATCC 38327]|eukprot:KNE56835.1 hypothetical protein AMAG_02608 [Allomyces macrogynus ATCC 38327]